MGRMKLQEVLKKKLGEQHIDMSALLKDPNERNQVEVNYPPARVNINTIANQLMTWLAEPIQEMTDLELDNIGKLRWDEYYRMDDARLCRSFKNLNRIYYTLKKRGTLGEREAEIDDIMEALRERMEIMANPYYDFLNPDVFEKIHSDTLVEIMEDPELFTGEGSVLYQDDDLDPRLNDAFLLNYLGHLARKNKADEKIQQYEVEHLLLQTAKEQTEELAQLLEEYPTLEGEQKKQADQRIKETYKSIIGCAMILQQTREKPVAHDIDLMYQVTSLAHIQEVASDIPDTVIDGFRAQYGDNALLHQLQEQPLEQSHFAKELSLISSASETEKARKWFNDMAIQLNGRGIDLFNPLSAGMLQIRQDTTEDEILDVPDFSTSSKGKRTALDRALAIQKYAMVDMDAAGNYKKSFDSNSNAESHSEWLYKNSVNALTISDEHVKYLYQMAKENRLVLKSIHPDTDKYQRNVYVKVSKDGAAVVTPPMNKLAKSTDFEQYGFSEKEIKDLAKLDEVYGSLEESSASLYYGTCTMYSAEIEEQKMLKNENEVKRLTEEYDTFKKNYSGMIAQREINADCVRHPQWYQNVENVRQRTEYFAVGKSLPHERTEEQVRMILENPVADRSMIYIEEQLLKMTGCANLPELMKSGLVKEPTGKPIEAENDYEYLKKVYQTCFADNMRIIVGDKKYVYDPSGLGFDADTEERTRDHWFASLRKQMEEMGYTNPMSMMMLRVQGDANGDELMSLPNTYEGGIRALQLLDECSKPALMPTDAQGNLRTPLQPDENPAAWVFKNMPKSWGDITPEQIDYLYRMAKENRLYLQSDEASVTKFEKNRFISITGKDTARFSKPMDEMFEEQKANPDAKTIDGYDAETFKTIFQRDNQQSGIEAVYEQFLSSLEIFHADDLKKDVKQHPERKEYFEAVKQQYYGMRNGRVGFRDACANAHTHADWYKTAADAEKMTNIFIAAKKDEKQVTAEERAQYQRTPVASRAFEEIENALLKASGCKTLAGAMAGDRVSFAGGAAPIKKTNTLEFMSDIAKRMANGEELFIANKPYVYVPGIGFKKGINKAAYVEEMKFLASRLIKTERNWTSNTPEYDAFAKIAKELPNQVNALKYDTEMSFDKLNYLIQPVINGGNQYLQTHRSKPLDSRQMERVKIINRFKDLAKEIEANSTEPGKNLDYRIAEKLVSAGCIRMKRGDLLMNEEYRTTCIRNTLNAPAFREAMQRYDEAGKMNILKMSGKKVLNLLYVPTEQTQPQAQVENAPTQPQIHN